MFFTFCTKSKKELLVFWNNYIISCFSYLVAWENLRRRPATTFETGVLWAAAATFSSSGRPPAEPPLKLHAAALSHSSHSHNVRQVSTNADLPIRLQKQSCHIYMIILACSCEQVCLERTELKQPVRCSAIPPPCLAMNTTNTRLRTKTKGKHTF